MGVFYRRPFAVLCTSFILSAVVGWFICTGAKLAAIIAVGAVEAFFVLLTVFRKCSRRRRRRLIFVCVAVAVILVSLVESYIYFDVLYLGKEKYYGDGRKVELVATERLYTNSMSTVYSAEVLTVDGEAANCKAYFTTGGNSFVQPGYHCEFYGVVGGLDGNYYGDERNLLSDGYLLYISCEDSGDIRIIDGNGDLGISVKLKKLKAKVSAYIRKSVGGDEGRLAAALFIGDRDCVPDDVTFDFSRSGISHLLALSGLHVSIILGGIGIILAKLGVKRQISAVILAVLSFAYLAITGFSPSACRAVIMADTVYVSWFFMSRSDSVTSVCFAAMLILLISPESVASYGYWLSCVSVFGLVVFMPTIGAAVRKLLTPIKFGIVKRFFSAILNGISVGLVATASVCFFTMVWFGQLSYMSAPITLLLSVPLTVLLTASLLLLVLGRVPFLSRLIGFAAQKSAGIILRVASDVSDTDGVLLSMNYTAVTVAVIIATVALTAVVLIVIKSENVRIVLSFVPVLCAVCIIFTAILSGVNDRTKREVIYVSTSSQSEQIILTHGNSGVICDMSSGGTQLSKITLDTAKSNCLTQIEVLVMTGYNSKQPSELSYICNNIKVKRLWLPEPCTLNEYYYMKAMITTAGKIGIPVTVYQPGAELKLFGDSVLTLEKQYIERSTKPLNKLIYNTPDGQAVWLTPALFEYTDRSDLSDNELVIFSGSGPVVHLDYGFDLGDGSTVIFNNIKTARSADGAIFEKENKIRYILEPTVFEYELAE